MKAEFESNDALEEISLGRALALTALAPIAGGLADQREREEIEAERQRVEKATAERVRAERDGRINSGRADRADLDDLAQEASSIITHNPDPEIVGQVWTKLVASGVIGSPTHDVLGISFSKGPGKANELLGGDYFTARWSETSRKNAWLAPGAGRSTQAGDFAGESTDAWVDEDGTVWVPHPARVVHGGVFVVPHGTSLQARRRGLWHKRSIEFVNAILVDANLDASRHDPHNPTSGLRGSVMAALKARQIKSSDGILTVGGDR